MRSTVIGLLVLASMLLRLLPAWAETPAEKREEIARALVSRMAAGDFEKAVESFDDAMRKALPADKLKPVWNGIVRQYGPWKQAGKIRTESVKAFQIVYLTCEFQRGKLDTKVVFSLDDKVTGLFFVPSGEYQSPPYAVRAAFEEREVQIGTGLLTLPGTVSLPKGDGPFPGVVLVHGSGPQDRDETIGPNKPFRDLAHGLASRGIAVLRYEKRTRQHPLAMVLLSNSITVKEETIDDAAAAAEALAVFEKIDGKRVFVLGHSLGGMLIPRISAANGKIAGFISLAGSARPMEDLILEQTKYILSLNDKLADEEQKLLSELERQVAKVKSPELSSETPKTELPLGVPASYWLALRGYDPAESAKAMPAPLLVLQGERDYQVTMADFGRWKAALSARKDATFISYPTLNHLFMTGDGKSTPTEYASPGNVAEAVVKDIAAWIKGGKAP